MNARKIAVGSTPDKSEPEVLAAEIVEDLRSTLKQIAGILVDLESELRL